MSGKGLEMGLDTPVPPTTIELVKPTATPEGEEVEASVGDEQGGGGERRHSRMNHQRIPI